MARTFEYVSHFVRCVTVTVSPNQIIIIIIIIIIIRVISHIYLFRFDKSDFLIFPILKLKYNSVSTLLKF